jgi:hypothetical protein
MGMGKGGFLGSDPRIYREMKLGGNVKKLKEKDIIGRLSIAVANGFAWNGETLRLSRPGKHRIALVNTPWVHGNHPSSKTCGFDTDVVFNMFGFIAPKCLKCWKTCVSLNNYDTAMKVMEYEKTYPTSCKVGMELRDYTPRHWGAYFYRNSFDEGRDTYKKVKSELNDVIGPDNFSLVLKRGCTEFELLTGPSLFWDLSEEQKDLYEILIHHFEDNDKHHVQPDLMKNSVLTKWPLWAHSNGDFSYVPYNGGEEFWGKLVPYHEGERDQVKEEMALALALSKGEVIKTEEEEIKTNIVKDTPTELTGDSDELT